MEKRIILTNSLRIIFSVLIIFVLLYTSGGGGCGCQGGAGSGSRGSDKGDPLEDLEDRDHIYDELCRRYGNPFCNPNYQCDPNDAACNQFIENLFRPDVLEGVKIIKQNTFEYRYSYRIQLIDAATVTVYLKEKNGPGRSQLITGNYGSGEIVSARDQEKELNTDFDQICLDLVMIERGSRTYCEDLTISNAPILDAIPDFNLKQGVLFRYELSATDNDCQGDCQLTFTADQEIISTHLHPITGVIRFIPSQQDVVGSPYLVKITVEDIDGNRDTQQVRVTVNNENDPPIISDLDRIEMLQDQIYTREVLSYITDPDGDLMHVSVDDSNAPHLAATIVNSEIKITPSPGFYGTEEIILSVEDGTVTVTKTITVNVRQSGSGAPFIDPSIPDFNLDEDFAPPVTWLLKGTDPDGDQLTWDVIGVDLSKINAEIIGMNTLKLTSVPDADQDTQITITVTDRTNIVTQDVDISITPINDPPRLVNIQTSLDISDGPEPIDLRGNIYDPDSDFFNYDVQCLFGARDTGQELISTTCLDYRTDVNKNLVIDRINDDARVTFSLGTNPAPEFSYQFRIQISDGEAIDTKIVRVEYTAPSS